MLSIEESRKILGSIGEKMSDEEISKLRNELYQLVSLSLDSYIENKRGSK